jgi:cyclic pyranopterin phosphate synthase
VSGLTHFGPDGAAVMVDVTDKPETERIATAAARILMQKDTLAVIQSGTAKKGDVLGVARIAGIMGAKRTAELIPLCHALPITSVVIEFEASGPETLDLQATVRTTGRTGVEMEALTAVSVAALTVYDMCKAIDRGMRIEAIRVILKDGGTSGRFEND